MDQGLRMSPDAPVIKSVVEMATRFSVQLAAALPDWETRLKATPDDLEKIEREVHALTTRGADMVVCGLMSVAIRDPAIEKKTLGSRAGSRSPLTDAGRTGRLDVLSVLPAQTPLTGKAWFRKATVQKSNQGFILPPLNSESRMACRPV